MKQTLTELADWLAYMRGTFNSLIHIPEIQTHCAKLAFWEGIVRGIADRQEEEPNGK